MNYPRIIMVVVSVIILSLIAVFTLKEKTVPPKITKKDSTIATSTPDSGSPTKTDFGAMMPTDFPTDIPVEKSIKFEQSYSLNYSEQKQLTIVFLSSRSVKENYALYSVFLKIQNWNISNKYESLKVSSLYGTKDSNDINITISESAASGSKSQVSISVLKK